MELKKIVVGRWYETTSGIGQMEVVGGTHPPSVRIRITHPFPRGSIYLSPREVKKEVPAPPSST